MDSLAAEASVAAHLEHDPAVRLLAITVDSVSPESVELSLPVTEGMLNGLDIVHGGYVFLLADTAFAYSCVAVGRPSATRTAEITYLTPARAGGRLHAVSVIKRQSGRTTICDVSITDGAGNAVAEFRGNGSVRADHQLGNRP